MRILHLATSKGGGAGIAASRLNSALVAAGHDSILLTLDEIGTTTSLKQLKNLFFRKFFTLVNQLNTRKGFISTSTFSQNSVSHKDLSKISADVIHIHNWYNLLSIETLLSIANKYPTLLTMHDERIYTGSCHYSLGCNGYLTNCAHCPATLTFHKQISSRKSTLPGLLQENSHFAVAAPSQWILDRLNTTDLGRKILLSKCIPNIIPIPSISTGSPIEQTKESDLHLLFAAVNPEAPTKGLDMLIAASSELALENPQVAITLNIVGKRLNPTPSSKNLTLISHGFLPQEELAELFKKVHLVVVPSRIDNSPSIISEAQLNRVLVLATKVGGIPELIEDSITGLLCEPNVNSLKLSIMRSVSLVNKEEIIEKGMKQASYRHNSESVVLSHIGVYQKLIAHG